MFDENLKSSETQELTQKILKLAEVHATSIDPMKRHVFSDADLIDFSHAILGLKG